MGFGMLFVGYINFLLFKLLPPLMILGAFLMYRGLKKLSIYDKSFALSSLFAAALGVYFSIYTVFWLLQILGVSDIINIPLFELYDSVVYYSILLGFHVFLYKALEKISRFCGYDKGIKKAYFSRVLITMLYVLVALNIIFGILKIDSYAGLAALICQAAWIIYTAAFLYSCYMKIATEEIIESEEKKLREYDEKYSFRTKKKGK